MSSLRTYCGWRDFGVVVLQQQQQLLLLLPYAALRSLRLRLNVLLQVLLKACKVLLVRWIFVDVVSGKAWQRLHA